MPNIAIQNPGRRRFLRTAPVAAVAGLTIADASLFAPSAAAQSTALAGALAPKKVSAQEIQADAKALAANPGNNYFVDAKSFSVLLTAETAKSGTEFEWHEQRDHVIQVVEGSTVIWVGGTPKNGHSIGPGEWKAPDSEGAVSFALNKGDMLIIPRTTPHKRITTGTVTLLLVSPQGTVSA